jgi:hypothetical protein
MQPQATRHRRLPPAAILLVPLVAGLLMALFAWPSARLEPRRLPVGVAGPSPAAHAIEQRLAASKGSFDIHRYAGEAPARQAIKDRDVYGAVVATAHGAEVLTSSAASRTVAQLLTRAASGKGPGAAATTASVHDVAADAPASSALPSTVLPLVIAGSLAGVLTMLLAGGLLPRAGLLVAGAALGGAAATAILQSWLGVVGGDWAADAGVLSLTILSVGACAAGAYALLGQTGTMIVAATMALIGNPFSGVSSAPELLPRPVGLIGQLMPPGAGSNLLRSTGFFDGAGGGGHAAVLAAWTLAGLIGLVAAAARGRGTAAGPAPAAA